MKKRVLVIDIGGTHVKLMLSRTNRRKFKSGPTLTPRRMLRQIEGTIADWDFDVISIGFPSPLHHGRIASNPKHLGRGWVGFDFEKAFGKPVRLINDAAMQALGSYHGGRLLFLGLGTGLGSALVWKNTVLPLELSELPYRDDRMLEDYLGKAGLLELGEKSWQSEVTAVIPRLKRAFIADYVVLGGGNTKELGSLPPGVERGHNRNAFLGGARLWQTEPRTRRRKWTIL